MDRTKVLVVDDEPDCSRLVQVMLEKEGTFEVCVVNGSRDAMNAARVFRPDIFVMDVDMPGKDGGELAREIREDPVLFDVPILFLTGLISGGETGGAKTPGCARFLPKPPVPHAFFLSIDQLLGEAASRRRDSRQKARSV